MNSLNYQHLMYFWVVAREGGLAPASKILRLARPTLSGQIRQLEESLGESLFERTGRKLIMTEIGKAVYQQAEEIFTLGQELVHSVKGHSTRQTRLRVGVTDVVPKIITQKLFEPLLDHNPPVQLICEEDRFHLLLASLAVHEYDVVITDSPVPPGTGIRAFNHPLGQCGVTFFAEAGLARSLRGRFPKCLDGIPFLVPTEESALRSSLRQWFETHGVNPRIVAEIEDSALLSAFGQGGHGVFCAPSVVENAVVAQYGVKIIGRTEEILERYYAITIERRIKHPGILAITDFAKSDLFG